MRTKLYYILHISSITKSMRTRCGGPLAPFRKFKANSSLTIVDSEGEIERLPRICAVLYSKIALSFAHTTFP